MNLTNSKTLDPKILKFLSTMELFTISVLHNGLPYSASCFYKFDGNKSIIFASSPNSIHILSALNTEQIVGVNIAKFSKKIANLQGVQARGVLSLANENEKKLYIKSYPISTLIKTEFYKISLKYLKFTDNTICFGKKIEYKFD